MTSTKLLGVEEQGMSRMVQQVATWDKKHTTKRGHTTTTACDHCGEEDADVAHVS